MCSRFKNFQIDWNEFSVNFKDILYFLQGNETSEFLREIFNNKGYSIGDYLKVEDEQR